MSDCGCGADQAHTLQRKTLIILLMINAIMFVFEFGLGWFAESTGLIADSLDMLADAFVYGLSLYAVGHAVSRQVQAARLSGYLQLLLGVGVLIEVVRRTVTGSEPQSLMIMAVALVALVANVICMLLISKHKDSGVHMKASWIFSTNDVIANTGVIVAGLLVFLFESRIPDLVIGTIISIVVIRGGLRILQESKNATEKLDG